MRNLKKSAQTKNEKHIFSVILGISEGDDKFRPGYRLLHDNAHPTDSPTLF
jgi:hypothetical protein